MLRTIEKRWIRLINKGFFYLPPSVYKWNIISGNFELNITPKSCIFFSIFGLINILLGLQTAFVIFSSIFLHNSNQIHLNIGQITVVGVIAGIPLSSYSIYVLLHLYPSTVHAINQIGLLNFNYCRSKPEKYFLTFSQIN